MKMSVPINELVDNYNFKTNLPNNAVAAILNFYEETDTELDLYHYNLEDYFLNWTLVDYDDYDEFLEPDTYETPQEAWELICDNIGYVIFLNEREVLVYE
jgi:hypothetical protein